MAKFLPRSTFPPGNKLPFPNFLRRVVAAQHIPRLLFDFLCLISPCAGLTIARSHALKWLPIQWNAPTAIPRIHPQPNAVPNAG
jgi:hypothetical protein